MHGSQDNNATATVLWDNAFAEPVSGFWGLWVSRSSFQCLWISLFSSFPKKIRGIQMLFSLTEWKGCGKHTGWVRPRFTYHVTVGQVPGLSGPELPASDGQL